jgi:exodeoxyribonuclease VII small subunit
VTEHPPDWTPEPAETSPAGPAAEAPADVAPMTFEQALAELETIVQDLERGQLDLDAAIRAYERGTRLKTHCEGKLREAQLRVERISLGEAGQVRADPTDLS